MRVLILGGRGMAGHMLVNYLAESGHDVLWTKRRASYCRPVGIPLNASVQANVLTVLDSVRPQLVVNAIGLLNQQAEVNVSESIYVNSLLPHWLAKYGEMYGYRVFHISTDCVFSGTRGGYSEADDKDGTSVYAQTKSLGELNDSTNLTIRTSIIGPEVKRDGIGLFHWLMHQTGDVPGYKNVYWNGVTTLQLAIVVEQLINTDISGLVHLTGPHKLSKLSLLQEIKSVFELGKVDIGADEHVKSDKTLLKTRSDFSPEIPAYRTMLEQLRKWMLQHKEEYRHLYKL